MSNTANIPAHLFNLDQQQQLNQLLQSFSPAQLQWLAGYLTGLQQSNQHFLQMLQQVAVQPQQPSQLQVSSQTITILYGSKSGNSKKIAQELMLHLQQQGLNPSLRDMNRFTIKDLEKEKLLILLVSTHGEGDPPPAAEDLHAALHSRNAPSLTHLKYTVLALGDKSYASFCQTGKDFDKRLSELGGSQLLERTELDVSFEEDAAAWIATVGALLQAEKPMAALVEVPAKSAQNGHPVAITPPSPFNRKNPFEATVLDKIQLNGRGSNKATYHLELSLKGSGLNYVPGDTVGIFASNDASLIHALLEQQHWNGSQIIVWKEQSISFYQFLQLHAELTTLSGQFLENYLSKAIAQSAPFAADLKTIIENKTTLNDFVFGKDVLDMLIQYPLQLDEQAAVEILMPLQPRLYSIASSLHEHPEEVHLTIGQLTYHQHQREHHGITSGHIAHRIQIGDTLKIFIDRNESFRLPEDPGTPAIMIGPGTGIAPFRSFIEERAATGANGKNWLFFGDQHFTTDFLYQTEWQRYKKRGVLTHIHTAFSRDTPEKKYVQHKLKEHATELYQWMKEGAHIYVCGEAKKMAKDVKKTFIQMLEAEGKMDTTAAEAFVKWLVKEGRYQEDVY